MISIKTKRSGYGHRQNNSNLNRVLDVEPNLYPKADPIDGAGSATTKRGEV